MQRYKKNPNYASFLCKKKQRSSSRLDLCFGSMHVERNLVVNADELVFAIELEFETGIEFGFPTAVVFAPFGNERVWGNWLLRTREQLQE